MTEDHRLKVHYVMTRMRSRCWCGTVWLDEDIRFLKALKWEYLLIGHKETTEEGQEHWHCMIKTSNPQICPRTKNAHWEMCGKPFKFKEYACKEGPPEFEEGEAYVNQNCKEDWVAFVEMCKSKKSKRTNRWSLFKIIC